MLKKTVSGIMLTILLIGTLYTMLDLKPVAVWSNGGYSSDPNAYSEHDYIYITHPWGDWKHYHNYTEIVNTLLYLNLTYPSIVDVFSIGKSWQNRDIYCIRLTNESNTHPKPKLFFVGYHHAREPISAELPLYFAVEAATKFSTNETITRMLNYSEIYIVPMLNVDAFEAFKQNEWQRKNVHPFDEDSDALFDEDPPDDQDGDGYIEYLMFSNETFIRWEGIDNDTDGWLNEDWVGGVDINRNYGYQWNATCYSGSPYTWAEDYRGPAPFSEPETQAIRDLALQHDFKYAVSFHSGSEVIGYPWGYTTDPTSDDIIFRQSASNLSALVGAPYGQSSAMYTMSGSWDDWMYANRSTFALTCEIYGNVSAWHLEPGPEPDTWWMKGVFQFFNPDPSQIETVIQRWLPVFTYITNRAITEEKWGLLIKIYPNQEAEFMALNAGGIDIVDSPLPKEWIDRFKVNPDIVLANYSELGMFEFDINNQRWPTNNTDFRRALAHLVDKDRMISECWEGYGERIDTPVPAVLKEYINPTARIYEYNTTKASAMLDALGFVDTDGDKIRNDPKTGLNMDPLIFYGRIDDIHRRRAAEMLTEEMTNIGIPVVLNITGRRQCVQEVMVNREYHLYTGGWTGLRDPDYLPWLYGSIGYLDPGTLCNNYPGFINATYDYWADKILHSLSHDEIKEAVFKCQEILADQAGIIPILSRVSVKAYRTDWEGVVNEVGRGVDSWWTFLNAHPINITKGGTIRWGFRSDIMSLNPVNATTAWDWNVLGEIYDTLLKYNPYNVTEDIPWMAESYEVGTWFNPDTGTICTKLTFQLPTDIYFHDAVQCTAEDVKFTIDYLKQFPNAYLYWSVADVHHVDTPSPFTVVVYENITSCWTLHWIGGLPILPRHVWEDIEDPTGFAPDPNLVGTGPFKFVEYVPGDHILLQRNPEYRTRTYLHDVAVVSVTPSAAEVYMGQIVNITVVVRNEGTANETFAVTAYYDNTIIGTQIVTDLIPGTKSLTFSWDTTGVALGDYTIIAEASVVAGETDTTDNTLVDGTVKVKMVKIVEVIPCDQVGNPKYTFETGTMAYFKVTINNTAIAPANMLLTINAYDSNGTTIGVTSFQGSITPGVSVFILGLSIPTSANVGTATVYANAFTDWPHQGGVPHCPEMSATFEITGP